MNFYAQIKNLCYRKDVTGSKMCDSCGFSRSMLAKWEDGASPKIETCLTIANYFQIDPRFFLSGYDEYRDFEKALKAEAFEICGRYTEDAKENKTDTIVDAKEDNAVELNTLESALIEEYRTLSTINQARALVLISELEG